MTRSKLDFFVKKVEFRCPIFTINSLQTMTAIVQDFKTIRNIVNNDVESLPGKLDKMINAELFVGFDIVFDLYVTAFFAPKQKNLETAIEKVKLFLSVLGRRNLCKRVTDPRTLYK
jgi:hypothetical protein